jgi:hypothetical protein
MSVMVRIRNVPKALHRRLKSRARARRMSLSEYLLEEIRVIAKQPTVEELRARLEHRSRVTPSISAADAVRVQRDREAGDRRSPAAGAGPDQKHGLRRLSPTRSARR